MNIQVLWVVVLAGMVVCARAGAVENCVDNTKNHSALLNPPASGQEVRFLRCGETEKAIFRIRRAFPGDSVLDLISGRWKEKGWLPTVSADASWQLVVSKDRLRVARVRKIDYVNAKGQRAALMMTYFKQLQEPILEGLPSEQLDLGDDLHVEVSLLH